MVSKKYLIRAINEELKCKTVREAAENMQKGKNKFTSNLTEYDEKKKNIRK